MHREHANAPLGGTVTMQEAEWADVDLLYNLQLSFNPNVKIQCRYYTCFQLMDGFLTHR